MGAWKRRASARSCIIAAALAGTGTLAVLAAPASAQPPIPPPPTRDEIRAPVQPRTEEQRRQVSVEGDLPPAPCALDEPGYEAIRVTPRAIEFENLRGLAAADLRQAYEPFLGTDQPLSVICRIRDRAAAILREAGYLAAVEVPEQRIEDGVIRLRVLTARLIALRVRGDAGANERLIARYLDKLVGQEVFNRYEAERYLLLAGDLPGYNVRLALRPAGTVPGEVVGEVTVARLPGQLDLNLQNFGSRAVGREGGLLRGQLFGLTGLGDRTVAAFYTTADFDEQQTLQLAHDFRIGGEGLQISGQLTYSWANPDTGDALIDLKSRTLFASLETSYPLIRSQRFSLFAGGGFDWADQEVDFNGLPLSQDQVRTGYLSVDLAAVAPVGLAQRAAGLQPEWLIQAGLELRQGFDVFGATGACGADFANCLAPGIVPPGRLEGDATAGIVRGRLAVEVRPVPDVTLFLGGTAQWTSQPLLSFEEFSAGNYTVGRGYDPAIIVGDKGLGMQAELRIGRLEPQGPRDLAIQPYVFFDAAWVGNEDRLFAIEGPEHLHSVGGGVRAVWGDRAQLDAVFAVPLVRTGLLTETPDPRLLISLTTRLWPWSVR